MSRYAPPTLPVQMGVFSCRDCWVGPGEEHQLSCVEVSPALFADFLAWQQRPARPSRLRLVGDAIAAVLSALTTTPTRRRATNRRNHERFAEALIARDRRTNGDTP